MFKMNEMGEQQNQMFKGGPRWESGVKPGPGFHVIMYWKKKNPGKLFALVRDKKKYQN